MSWGAGRGAGLGVANAWAARLVVGVARRRCPACAAWSVRTEGSERDRWLVALARRPPGPGRAIRIVSGAGRHPDVESQRLGAIRTSRAGAGRVDRPFARHVDQRSLPRCPRAGGASAPEPRRRSVTSPSARRPFGAHTNRTPNHAPTLSPNTPDHPSAVATSRSAAPPTPHRTPNQGPMKQPGPQRPRRSWHHPSAAGAIAGDRGAHAGSSPGALARRPVSRRPHRGRNDR
jgi:hypothetical protein